VGFKLAEGKGLREGRDSKEMWKSVEKAKAHLSRDVKDGHLKLELWQSCGHRPINQSSLIRFKCNNTFGRHLESTSICGAGD